MGKEKKKKEVHPAMCSGYGESEQRGCCIARRKTVSVMGRKKKNRKWQQSSLLLRR